MNTTCLRFWILQINDYLRDVLKYQLDPLPEVVFDETENDPSNLLIRTGHYDYTKNQIVLNVSNRHIKDILRTYCHELVHHH